MNEMLYFPETRLSYEELAQIVTSLGHNCVMPSTEKGDLIIQFDTKDVWNKISNWHMTKWDSEVWEQDIVKMLEKHALKPNTVFLIEFTSTVLSEITRFLAHVLDKHGGVIEPSVGDNFILHKDNLTLVNMRKLYEPDDFK